MFLIVLNFLRQHIVAVAEIALLSAIFLQHVEISHLNGALTACKSENMTLSSDNADLSSLIERQDAGIMALKSASDKKGRAAAQLLARAKVAAEKYVLAAQTIQSHEVHDDCADMRALLNDYFRR